MAVGRAAGFGATVITMILMSASAGGMGPSAGTPWGTAGAGASTERTAALVDPAQFPGYDAGFDTTQVAQPITIVRLPF
jgi:hypothetical protein